MTGCRRHSPWGSRVGQLWSTPWASKLFFFDKGPQLLLLAGSRTAHVKVTVSGIHKLLCNFYSIYIIYRRGRGPHNTMWRAAGCWPMTYTFTTTYREEGRWAETPADAACLTRPFPDVITTVPNNKYWDYMWGQYPNLQSCNFLYSNKCWFFPRCSLLLWIL